MNFTISLLKKTYKISKSYNRTSKTAKSTIRRLKHGKEVTHLRHIYPLGDEFGALSDLRKEEFLLNRQVQILQYINK